MEYRAKWGVEEELVVQPPPLSEEPTSVGANKMSTLAKSLTKRYIKQPTVNTEEVHTTDPSQDSHHDVELTDSGSELSSNDENDEILSNRSKLKNSLKAFKSKALFSDSDDDLEVSQEPLPTISSRINQGKDALSPSRKEKIDSETDVHVVQKKRRMILLVNHFSYNQLLFRIPMKSRRSGIIVYFVINQIVSEISFLFYPLYFTLKLNIYILYCVSP